MKFERRGNEIWYDGKFIDAWESKGEAMAVIVQLEAAYKDGVKDGSRATLETLTQQVQNLCDEIQEELNVV